MGYNVVLLSLAGSSYYITSYAHELAATAEVDRVRIVIPPWSPEAETLDSETVELVPVDVHERLFLEMVDMARPSTLNDLLRGVTGGDPDILHVINEIRVPPHVLALLRRQCDCPVVLTVHEPDPYLPTLLRRAVLNHLQRWNLDFLSKYVDRYVVHGDMLAGKLAKHVSRPEHITVVPHGSFADVFLSETEHGPPTGCEVLFFGRAVAGKGLPDLVEAAHDVHEAVPDAEFVIAGNGYDPDKFGAVSAPYFTVYDNRVSVKLAAKLFERASVVVMPYENASASGIVSIAGGFRRPVVATAVGSFPEIIDHGETGLLVPPRSPDTLAQALEALLCNPDRRDRLGENLEQVQRECWGWDTVVERTCEVYRSCLNSENTLVSRRNESVTDDE